MQERDNIVIWVLLVLGGQDLIKLAVNQDMFMHAAMKKSDGVSCTGDIVLETTQCHNSDVFCE